jgi:hypothetical protein
VANAKDVDDVVLIKSTVDEEMPVLNQISEYNISTSVDNDINRSKSSTLFKESGKFKATKSMKTIFQPEDCIEINADFALTAVSCVLIPTTTQSKDLFINKSDQNKNTEIDEDIVTSLPAWMKDEIQALDIYR